MIRILQVFHGMGCGGAENMIMNIYRNIDRSKIQFDFLVHTTKKMFFDDEIKELGGNIYRVPYYQMINGAAYKKSLNDFFFKHPEIKIVHGHLGSCAHIYLKIAKKHGCFAIAHSHNAKPQGFSLKNILYRLFTFKTRKVADYFFGCSQLAAEYRFGPKIANSDKCSILKNAIDLNKFTYSNECRKEIRNEFGIGDDQFVVGHIGRFNEQKNHLFLIDIFNEIHKKQPNSVLLLVGDGSLRKAIEEKVSCLNIKESVILTGVRADANKILSAMDVFVFPSLYEGLPVTLIEAQAAGLPIVYSGSITKEVAITNLAEIKSLNCNAKCWADFVIKKERANRLYRWNEQIGSAGYDIVKTSSWLANFYEQIHEGI